MKETAWSYWVMRIAGLAVLAALCLGCSGEQTPMERAAGTWTGAFDIQTVDGRTDRGSREPWEMRGNLWLYVGGRKFRLEMATAHQQFTVNGKWTAEDARITLRSEEYDFQFPTQEKQESLNLPIIPAEDIRAAFHQPMALDLSPDRRRLTGLTLSLGKIAGSLKFERPIPR